MTEGGINIPFNTWNRVQVVENGLIFDSLEEAGRMISALTSWNMTFIKDRIRNSILDPTKDFLSYHFISIAPETNPSDDDVLKDWIKTLNIQYQGKHIYSNELNMEFETIGTAAKYLIDNGYYIGTSKTPIQSLITSIGYVINGKYQYVNSTSIDKLTFIQVPGTTKQKGGEKVGVSQAIYCPQLNKKFKSQVEAANYMIDNNIWTGIKLKTAKLRISDVIRGVFPDYKGYAFQKIEE